MAFDFDPNFKILNNEMKLIYPKQWCDYTFFGYTPDKKAFEDNKNFQIVL